MARKKVDLDKVNLPVINDWIATTLNKYLPDDEIVIDYAIELLQDQQHPDLEFIEAQLHGFLNDKTNEFCEKLWSLLQQAQSDRDGIPLELIEQKREQLKSRQ